MGRGVYRGYGEPKNFQGPHTAKTSLAAFGGWFFGGRLKFLTAGAGRRGIVHRNPIGF